MPRNGKIARLPKPVRDQLNALLAEGLPGYKLIEWLNRRPEVQEVLTAEFFGEPVSHMNLTRWKQGGYQDWVLQQETRELVGRLTEEGDELLSDAKEPVSDRVGVWLAARYALLARKLAHDGDTVDWKRLHELCTDVVSLRRSDHGARRLKLVEQRLQFEQQKALETKDKLFGQWSKEQAARKPPGLSLEEQDRRMRAIFGMPPREPVEPMPGGPGFAECVPLEPESNTLAQGGDVQNNAEV